VTAAYEIMLSEEAPDPSFASLQAHLPDREMVARVDHLSQEVSELKS